MDELERQRLKLAQDFRVVADRLENVDLNDRQALDNIDDAAMWATQQVGDLVESLFGVKA